MLKVLLPGKTIDKNLKFGYELHMACEVATKGVAASERNHPTISALLKLPTLIQQGGSNGS